MGRKKKLKPQLNAVRLLLNDLAKESDYNITINELFAKCYKDHWMQSESYDSQWTIDVKRFFNNEIEPTFGDSKAINITINEVRVWHAKRADKPVLANRCLAVLSKLFSFAMSHGYLPLGSNPCAYVPHFPERKRSVYAKKESLLKLIEVLKSEYEDHKKEVTYIFLLMYTGARPAVFQRARWSDLTIFEAGGKTFGKLTIKGKTFYRSRDVDEIVIPPQGMKLIENLPKTRLDGKIVGCSRGYSFWKRIVNKAGCPELWLRDLRRTFATLGLSNGESIDVLAEVLNHKSTQTTKIYAKLNDEKRVEAVSAIANVIENMG